MRRPIIPASKAVLAIVLLVPFAGAAPAQSVILTEPTVVALDSAADAAGGFSLTAHVTTRQGAGVPGGSIQFIDETTLNVLGWAEAASPSITVASLPAGPHVIRADYRGTDAFLPLIVEPSQSEPLILNVLSKPAVTLSSSQNPSAPGQLVTLTAKVSGEAGAAIGAVTFRDGSAVLAAHVALDSCGTASFTTSALHDGLRAITAEYEGDGDHAPAVSMRLEQDVGLALLPDAAPSRGM
ncbi:MAG: Ig-like domain repeat protein [Rhodopseudomonas sp.]|uniref:Ig-like domain-containing protein n=1 Tax=Rhodopseudomonas sp. TaxID=1078 RepID=UPI0018403CC4|nr:Ig-like domain-containing protein [Rhodopseudomonas sp.]NVN84661.1 Ig-like domain repeat protein [Rhodopseudomonas sp.]